MTTWFFRLPTRISVLQVSAETWKGTPWRAHSCVRGEGASCHLAVYGVLRDCGFEVGEVPDGPANWARHQERSMMEDWLNASPIFQRIPLEGIGPGDVVGFRVGLCVHHLGLVLSENTFFQCLHPAGAQIMSRSEPAFGKRLAAAWRPLEVS